MFFFLQTHLSTWLQLIDTDEIFSPIIKWIKGYGSAVERLVYTCADAFSQEGLSKSSDSCKTLRDNIISHSK